MAELGLDSAQEWRKRYMNVWCDPQDGYIPKQEATELTMSYFFETLKKYGVISATGQVIVRK